MKFLFDFFPLILFFVAYKLADIYVATGTAIAASFIQVGWLLLRRRKIEPMLWASLAIVVVFGGATLMFKNDTFIKMKPTVLYWLFAAILAGAALGLRKNLMRSMLSAQIELPETAWARLNWSWAGFFAFMGAANLIVALNFDRDAWVNFKVFGGIGLMLLFVIAQALYLSRHIQESGGKS
ncbi:MAG: septation protein A [Betaproteobacteria bacterium]|nr:septation protein A [Betaproteobacteria bacterium]